MMFEVCGFKNAGPVAEIFLGEFHRRFRVLKMIAVTTTTVTASVATITTKTLTSTVFKLHGKKIC